MWGLGQVIGDGGYGLSGLCVGWLLFAWGACNHVKKKKDCHGYTYVLLQNKKYPRVAQNARDKDVSREHVNQRNPERHARAREQRCE